MAMLHRRFARAGEPVIHCDGRFRTTDELRTDSALVRKQLASCRIAPGDRVALIAGNTYAYIASYYAILDMGACVVPLNPDMPEPELRAVLTRAGAAAVVANREILARMTGGGDPFAPGLRAVVAVDDDGGQFKASAQAQDGERVSVEAQGLTVDVEENAGAILLFTSGTTGTPKGVLLTHRQVAVTVRNICGSHRLTPDDVCYAFLPLFHINAQVVGMLSTLASGGRIVLERRFSASRFWTTVREQRVTWVSAVPTVIGILIRTPSPEPAPSHLRFVRSASAPLPELYARRFEAIFSVPVIESYGMTEAASQICVNPVNRRKLGSVGVPWGIELRVVDESGVSVATGELGEIIVRGDNVVTAYASGDETGSSFRDGWFHTGDIGLQDAQGYVYITGRSKEMINRAGQKISPREVEEVISRHPGVLQVAVIGLPDELYGDRVVAYVVPAAGRVPRPVELREQIRSLCQSSISSYKCPEEVRIVSEIPVGPTGKIQRTRLREQVLRAIAAN
jgi:acyl-CoA synthetase (AMP-forming)/AMP-acid ligase II